MGDMIARDVLVVEDDRDTAELERRTLARSGIKAHLAATVGEAKAALEALTFQAVLLDYRLPDGDAWDVVELARSLTPPVPVVLVTAMGSEQVVAEAIQHGIVEYVRKSDRFIEQLPDAVRRVARTAQYEAKLRHSDALLQLIADHATDVILTLDDCGRLQYISPASKRLLDLNPADAVGRTLDTLVHPEDVALLTAQLDSNETSSQAVFRCRRGDEALIWVEANFQRIRDAETGAVKEILGVLRNITERRAADERLRESEQRFRGAFETAAHGMAIVSTEGRWLRVNRAICEMIGYSAVELLAIDFQTVTHPDDLDADLAYVSALLAGDIETYQMEKRYFHKEGSTVWVLLSVSLVRSADGTPLYFVSQIQNITDRKRVEIELVAARDAAEAAAHAKSDFLATMSHEIRTPMAGVLGMIELLRSAKPEDTAHLLDGLQQSARTLTTVLDDILDFSKIEGERLILEKVDFDLVALAEQTFATFEMKSANENLSFGFHFPDDANPIVTGDPTRLRQVIANLLSNAAKFTPKGQIELRIALAHIEDQFKRWRFTVEDTGIGIDREMIGALFAPFVQADAWTTRKYGGTGLGLAICRRLVEAMGGEIGVESEPTKGSCFWFEVPLPDAPVGTLPKKQADTEPTKMSPLRILLAEDNPINQTLIEGLLVRMHHCVTCVSHGRAAVDAVRSGRFDLVLMDMQMPEMDGPEAATAIRLLESPAGKVPIIALTADASIERRRLYEKAGINGFLFKPIDSTKLASIIGQIRPLNNGLALIDHDHIEHPVGSVANVLDWDRLELIARTLGAKQCDQLMAMLREDISERPANIEMLLASRDITAARRSAHSLSGAALHLGATRLAEAARQLEFDGPCADALLLELSHAATETIAAIDRYRAEREINSETPSPEPA